MEANINQRKIDILQSEDKKPPKLTNKEKSKTIITSEQEKAYLEGEPHVDESSADKEIMYPSLDVNLSHKKQIINKPREDYLKEKINKMDYNSNLFSNIQKGLGSQIDNIKNKIKEESLVLTEVPKDISKYKVNFSLDENNIIKYSNEEYENKKRNKIIKELKQEQISLKNKLKQIEENEALLNDEKFMSLNNSNQGTTKYDKSIKELQMTNIKNKKKEINEKLIEIETRINIVLDEERTKARKKINLQIFKENFERDKEIIEARAEKFLKETNERNKRFVNNINKMEERRKKTIEKKDREEKEKKDKKLKEFIEKEKAISQKRLNEKKAIMLKYKPYLNKKYEKTDDLYNINEKKYKENEQKLIDKLTREKKIKNKIITNEDLQEFYDKIDKKREEHKEAKLKRDKEELEKLEFVKNYKPSYVSRFNEAVNEEFNQFINKEKLRKEEILGLNGLKNNYGENIRNNRIPIVDENKQKERMDRIFALNNPKLAQLQETEKRKGRKKKRIILKKIDPNKPSKYKYELKLEDEELKNLNKSAIIQSYLIKRPKPIKFAYDYSKKKEEENDKDNNKINKDDKDIKEEKEREERKPIVKDYLREMARERQLTEEKKIKEKNEDNIQEIQKKREKKWKRQLTQKEGTIIQNIYNINYQAENLEEQAQREHQLLKLSGGIENNPELGKKFTGHLIDSIEAKLSILNQMCKK